MNIKLQVFLRQTHLKIMVNKPFMGEERNQGNKKKKKQYQLTLLLFKGIARSFHQKNLKIFFRDYNLSGIK